MSHLDDLSDHLLNNGTLRDTDTAHGGFALTQDNVRPGPPAPVSPDQSASGAIPARCVFLTPTGGQPSRGRSDPEELGVQVAVRSDPFGFDAGLALAIAVYDAVHLRPPPGYFDAIATQWPSHISQDEQGQSLFVFNVKLRRGVASG